MAVIYHCPSDKRLLCDWSGYASDIERHFIDEHRDLLYYKNNVDVNLKRSSDNKLIIINKNIYLLQINIVEKLLCFKLRYLGDNETASRMMYDLIINVNDSIFVPVLNREQWMIDLSILEKYNNNIETLICTISIHQQQQQFNNSNVIRKNSTYFDAVDLDDDVDVELRYVEALRYVQNKIEQLNENKNSDNSDNVSQINWSILEEPSDNIKSTTSPLSRQESYRDFVDNFDHFNDELHACFVCHKDMLPPIYLCVNGHNVCVNCRHFTCTCSGQITNIRNVEEENYSRTHQHPCRYYTNGCMERLYYNELRSHETKCYFCKYKCLINNCNYEEKYQQFIQHLKIHHSSIRIVNNNATASYDFPKDTEFFIVHRDKGIFYCRSETINDDTTYVWLAMFCGPKDRRFFCELRFKGSRLNDPLFLKNRDHNIYELMRTKLELKKMKVKEKNAVLTITSFD